MDEQEQINAEKPVLYDGKAIKIYQATAPDRLTVRFTDTITAYNLIKTAKIAGKGHINNMISAIIACHLEKAGIRTPFIKIVSEEEQLWRKADIIPIEVIVRNVIAGSMARRLGLEEGLRPANTVYDLCYKNDDLEDPLINDHHAVALGLVSYAELKEIYRQTSEINSVLVPLFRSVGIDLVDFKIEFGRLDDGTLVLADRITPDNSRLWDIDTGERLDKDRFRRDMGKVGNAYRDVLARLESVSPFWHELEAGKQKDAVIDSMDSVKDNI